MQRPADKYETKIRMHYDKKPWGDVGLG